MSNQGLTVECRQVGLLQGHNGLVTSIVTGVTKGDNDTE